MPIKAWTRCVALEEAAEKQLRNVALLPFVYKWVVAMPDVHRGIGATVGSVIPTKGATIPAAVGVDPLAQCRFLRRVQYAILRTAQARQIDRRLVINSPAINQRP